MADRFQMTKTEQFRDLTKGEKLNKTEVLGVFILETLEEILRELRKTPRRKTLIRRTAKNAS